MKKTPSFCVVGAGMSGLLMCIRLKQAGFFNVRVLEKAPELGGTWYYNRYPGVACDVPAPYYSYRFALNPDWSQKFASGEEVHQYFKSVAESFDLLAHIEFETEVLSAEFNGEQWLVNTSKGETFKVDYLISACGILHKAVFPAIEGLHDFKGKLFHSSEWDKSYQWQGKRIAVIGNGSTGVQMIPHLAKEAAQLTLFQRSPQWIMPAKNKTYSEGFKAAQHWVPGLKQMQYWSNRKTFESFTNLVLEEGWQRQLVRRMTRAMLATVKNDKLREQLTPDYEPGCKRLVMSNDFYRAMQRENARLCTDGIQRINEHGVETVEGEKIDFDLIVLATGFDPRAYMRPIKLKNELGIELDTIWKQEGIQAYRTVMLPDFANFFMVLGPNSPVGNFSVIAAAEDQTQFLIKLLKYASKHSSNVIRVNKTATQEYNNKIKEAMKNTIWLTGCNSWYLDEQGNSATWPWTPQQFRKDLSKPDFKDLSFE